MTSMVQQAPLTAPPIDYAAIAPLLIVLAAACLAVLVEAFLPRHQRWPAQVTLSVVALGAAGLSLALYAGNGPDGITTLANSSTATRLFDTRSVSVKSVRKVKVACACARSALSEASWALIRSVIDTTPRAYASATFV